MKSTVAQIRARFDKDVERFANLETGHAAMIDGALVLELISHSAAATNPHATHLLDIGCGAGNYSLKLLQQLPGLNVTLIDLSLPMLERAFQRVSQATTGVVQSIQGDIRELVLPQEQYDVIVAATVLHHLRTDAEWEAVFRQCYTSLKPGGSFWIADLISHDYLPVQTLMWAQYGAYLTALRDENYRDAVYHYIEAEDTPRSLIYQIDLLRQTGFRHYEILHKNNCFAAFGGVK